MRKISLFAVVLIVAACNQKQDASMAGAYSLTHQVMNDGTHDSSLDRGQLKIYTTNYMMYASPNITDSFANFGVGKYRVENGKVIEDIFYRASTGDTKETSILTIEKNPSGYRQVIDSLIVDGKKYKLTEEYDNVSATATSPLDGAWKQVKNVYIKANGDSMVNSNPLEYKVFQAGHFIWAITAPDSAQRPVSVYGYGEFTMNGNNKTRETVRSSTFQTGLVGKTYEVDITFPTADTYQQTITFANGDKSTEIYKRLN